MQIVEWLSPPREINARLVHFSSSDAQSPSHPERSLHRRSSRSNSSIASFRSLRSADILSNARTLAPSLSELSDATPTESSVSTSLASDLGGVPLLEDVNGVFQRRRLEACTPTFECSFWFLRCNYISHDQEEWKTHCLSHFRGEEPPTSVQCPLCDAVHTSDNGWTSWSHRQEHVATHHILGQTLGTSRPDFHLFHHLWLKRLISDQDWKELKGGNDNLALSPLCFGPTGRHVRVRRHQRRQRVGAGRAYNNVRQQNNMASQNAVITTQEREQPNPENAASMQVVNAPTDRPETLAITADPGHSTTEELRAAIQIRPTLSHREERLDPSRMDQEDALHVPSHGETQSHNILPSRSETPGSGINDTVDAQFHPETTLKKDQGSYESDLESLLCDSDLLEETECPEPTLEEQFSDINIDMLKEGYFALLMHSFNETQQPVPTDVSTRQNPTEGSSDASKGKHCAAAPPTTDSSQHRSSKRTRRRSPDKGDQDDQEEEDNRRNAPGGAPQIQEVDGPAKDTLFACPFVKRYPHRYLKCFSHSLKDISRVKQHLFRDKTHHLPIYCPKCSHTFEGEDIRDGHIRDAQCVKRPPVKWEGISESQRRQLSKRSPSTKSPEENWYGVFSILFPGEPLPSSPYIDKSLSGELRAFREHLLLEGPRIWNDFLTSQLPEHFRPYLEELQSLHDSFYAESIVRLCESWDSQRSPNSSIDTRDTREDDTNSHVVQGSISLPVAAPQLQNGSSPKSTDVRSGSYPTSATHGSHSVVAPEASILQSNHPLLDYQSTLDIQPTIEFAVIMDPPRNPEVSLYTEDIANSIDQSHIGAPHLQLGALERGSQNTCTVSGKFGETSDGLDATIQTAYPSQGDLPSFSSSLAQNHSDGQDIFRFLDIDEY